ncbi:PREDICTED: uncharacterized protein LOC104822234 [Tarenaya hassleriana]|uniref:uncharacterized protein LOC104822234 n=1 Tax=Tarenaya hassleriana TaxID=28532 RepID=UPI00053C0EE4|nr:PREDICTED: uncharacterized protein LOC104822234 [Tarenaya hassleriana]
MSHHHHRQPHALGITATGACRKRKETDSGFLCYSYRAMKEPESSNWLLAGYMAHEFLANGTLLGHKLEPCRPDATGAASSRLLCDGESGRPDPIIADPGRKQANQSYADVASVLKIDGTHVPGVVNPSQLARWIQM